MGAPYKESMTSLLPASPLSTIPSFSEVTCSSFLLSDFADSACFEADADADVDEAELEVEYEMNDWIDKRYDCSKRKSGIGGPFGLPEAVRGVNMAFPL